ncbi:hypothetical protein SAMN02910401_01864 [Megasphaera elsdenii]|jgi:hypothetical protein|uniref:Putative lipoprotein n=1 Tax=Megasphaera elsdenii DSM 20460 TaxID=1064535 RepID=G0VLR8_MEGEL|nr:hypothetical protein [Megasphaera elsdenii]AVO75043.1 hypothetical protein C6362_08930 [Megasphaera elsdenii DSM 20460]MCI7668311.1 hypothetical protein [Megasphaera elsdenii]MDY5382339.1 hypothetical protein [Megasphaera elsdenii]MEE3441704.1 hypothetical protein [Megasphaera elsdenii]CCC74266.1 putative lipoprotein [Megasphaera elsdenii DSM 20460]
MKGLKLLAVAAMTAAVVLLSGCGNMTMLEEYSFGYVQLKAGNSEVYVMTPFDLGRVNRQNGEGVMYINNDKHINVIAVSETAGETTPAAMAEEYIAMLKQTPDFSDLQTKVTDAEESGRKATVVNASYTEPLNGQPVKITARSLFFEDNGQIWHVMYIYRDGDALAKEVVDHVFGQLK